MSDKHERKAELRLDLSEGSAALIVRKMDLRLKARFNR